jgi:hypothetical protein
MTINFIPKYVIANEGCFFWGWYPPCDLQIYLFLPWIVAACASLSTRRAQICFVSAGVLFGMLLNFWIIWKNNLAAALFAPQDIMIFKIFITKPYTKICSVFLGVGMALMYRDIQLNKQGLWSRLR